MRCAHAVVLSLLLVACARQRGTIGAVLSRSSEGALTVHEVPVDLAARRAGLAPGDRILLVDGRDVRSFTEEELRKALGGEVGTSVKLTVLRGEEVVRVTVVRSGARRRKPSGPE